MMQLLLHGSAKTASRKKLVELKQKFDVSSVVVYGEGTDLQIILGTLVTPALFSGQQLVVLENPAEDLILCDLSNITCNLILWFDHEVNAKKWSNFEILFFPESKEISIFPFLDLLAAKDQRAYLEMERLKNAALPASKQSFDIYYFITMAFYLLRNLVTTPKNAPTFVKDKLESQKKNFPRDRIIKLYKDLLEIDFKIKSGLLEIPQAEFLLVSKFVMMI